MPDERCTNCHGYPLKKHFFQYALIMTERCTDPSDPVPIFCDEGCMKLWVAWKTGTSLPAIYVDYSRYQECHSGMV